MHKVAPHLYANDHRARLPVPALTFVLALAIRFTIFSKLINTPSQLIICSQLIVVTDKLHCRPPWLSFFWTLYVVQNRFGTYFVYVYCVRSIYVHVSYHLMVSKSRILLTLSFFAKNLDFSSTCIFVTPEYNYFFLNAPLTWQHVKTTVKRHMVYAYSCIHFFCARGRR